MEQSSELTGGAGFNFEANIAAFYMAALIGEESAPALNHRIVERIGLQQKGFGEPLDDVIVDAYDSNGEIARLSLQVKRSLIISAAVSNDDFRDIVKNSWRTLQKGDFRENIDRYGAATGTIAESPWRDLNSVCEFARASLNTTTFFKRFKNDGLAGQNHLRIVNVFRSILNEFIGQAVSDHVLYRFLKHFVLIKFDFLHEGATDSANAIKQLRHALAETDQHRAPDLWIRLVTLAREGAGRAEEFNRTSLLTMLAGDFRFSGAPSLKADLNQLTQLANLWLDDIATAIDGYYVARQNLLDQAKTLLNSHRFVQIRGLPGTGKSVLLRELAKSQLDNGTIIFLKSDRLFGRSWAEFSNSIGIETKNIEILLSEIAATGTAILFVDGIDRIQPEQCKIVLDLLNTILGSPILSNWSILVTSRDVGIEPLRNWLPSKLISNEGMGTVNVGPLNDGETEMLAKAKPSLRPLLFGVEQVREIARRPFFASVLARGLSTTAIQHDFIPQSETDLIKAWWNGGGYNADASDIFRRQHALEELAKIGAQRYGLRILRSELSPETIEILHILIGDGIISETQKGVAFRFKHDIFFEWAYFYFLQGKDDQWIEALTDAGEPPVLGRVVELLSQLRFASDSAWLSHLTKIEASSLRAQWLRAWLLGPFGAPDFPDHADSFTKVIAQNNFRRLPKLFVWFQAEKTTPNTFVLSGQLISADISKHELIRLADALGWPSDFPAWHRLITWTLSRIDSFPISVIPDVVSVFEVWQNAWSDVSNPLSNRIVAKCMEWLIDIEDRNHPEEWKYDYGKWDTLDRDDFKDLEQALRMLILRAARSAQQEAKIYIERIARRRRLRQHTFSDVMKFAPILAQQFPDELIELTRTELKDELPDDTRKRWKEEQKARAEALKKIKSKPESERSQHETMALNSPWIPHDYSHHDWHDLSIGRSHQGFFPASPLREPFGSLFKFCPPKALDLVRELTNYAMTAWLQLHKYNHEHRGTPIPIMLDFPWGQQAFWGNWSQYGWFRGWLGPQAIECALMALEEWAFREIDGGRDIDGVLRDVLEGHTCWSVLGIAVAIALETKHVSKTTLALLACQRLWHIEIQRQIEEHPSIPSNLIGFSGLHGLQKTEKPHYDAVKSGNSRKCRMMSLRDLTPLFALNPDEEIRLATREALESFPNNLPFSYEEEKSSTERVKELRLTAEIWAEWGKQENYKASQHPEDKNAAIIQLENPKAETPEFKAKLGQYEGKTRELLLWSWVHKTFENASLCSDLSFVDAVRYAKQFDRPDFFSTRTSQDSDLLLGAVAGVAAAALCFVDRGDQENVSWAKEVITRAFETPETKHDAYSSHAIIPWHPCIFVARALAAEIRNGNDALSTKEKLLSLAGHPLDLVSLEALKCAFDCWDIDDRFAWVALDLGMRLSIGSRRRDIALTDGNDPPDDTYSPTQSVCTAITAYLDGKGYEELTQPPPAWIFAPMESNRFYGVQRSTKPVWRDPDTYWRWDYAPKVLERAPLDKIMNDSARQAQYLTLCDSLLDWTIERINPTWKEDESEREDRKGTELLEWRREFSQMLAKISGYLDSNIVRERFLNKIFSQEDELSYSFLAPFVNLYICMYVLDAKTVRNDAIQILNSCLDRVLKDHTFKRSSYREGDLYGYDLPYLVRDLFFVSIENASGAARYANGCWDEIDIVLPLVDKFVRYAGWSTSVASHFLTLCERCGHCYPAELFADQVLAFLDTSKLPGWRRTILPARIAGLIQNYADREQPLGYGLAQKMLRILDALVDLGDRRSAALQISEAFKDVRRSKFH
jgi:hypothetical protein